MKLAWLALALTSWLPLQERQPVGQPYRGVVLDAETKRPLAHHPVQVERHGNVARTVLSDEEGRFEFTLPPHGALWLRAGPAPGYRALYSVPLGEGPSRVLATAVPTERLRGRVFQRGTEHPLRGYRFEVVEKNGPRESVVTDGEGRYETVEEYRRQGLRFASQETSARVRGATLAWRGKPRGEDLDLSFPAGPVLKLDLSGWPKGPLSGWLLPPGVDSYGDRADRLTRAEATVEGRGADARLPFARPFVRGPDEPLVLHVRSLDDHWVGSATVPPVARWWSERVRVEPTPRGSLRVFSDAWEQAHLVGFGPEEPTQLVLTPLDGQRAGTIRGQLRAYFSSLLRGLEPGSWRVEAETPEGVVEAVEVEVVPGEEVDVRLTPRDHLATEPLVVRVGVMGGDVPTKNTWRGAGIVPTAWIFKEGGAPGRYLFETSTLCGTGVHGMFRRVRREGRWCLEAGLADPGPGPYRARVWLDGQSIEREIHPGRPWTLEVGPPAYRFEVSDARTGKDVDGVQVWRGERYFERTHLVEPDAEGVFGAGDWRFGEGLFCFEAPGYARAYVDAADFLHDPSGRHAEVALRPGWAVRLEVSVRDRSRGPLLLRLDGHEWTLDPNGDVVLYLAHAPAVHRLAFDGHRIVGGTVEPGGLFQPNERFLRVELEPRE